MNKLANMSPWMENKYRAAVRRARQNRTREPSRREFLQGLRRARRTAQKEFRDKNPLANKYWCWCGQKFERNGVPMEKFALFYNLAVKDRIGRINPKNPFNIRLMEEMGIPA